MTCLIYDQYVKKIQQGWNVKRMIISLWGPMLREWIHFLNLV